MTGTLLESPQGKKRVRVKLGRGNCWPQWRISLAWHEGRRSGGASVIDPHRVSPVGGGLDEQTVVDVRGKAADEALDDVLRR